MSILRFAIIQEIDFSRFKKPPSNDQIRLIRATVQSVIRQYGIKDEWIRYNGERQDIQIPVGMHYYQMYGDIVDQIQQYNAQVCSSSTDLRKKTRTLEICYKNYPIIKLLFLQKDNLSLQTARVAIIIDDFGYGFDRIVEGFIKLPHKLTLSIIPGQKNSERVARESYHNGKEVMIHLPMEPLEDSVQDIGYTIFTHHSESQVREQVRKAIENVPFAKGLNNHKGSKATLEERILKPLFQELKKQKLYFIDSRTNPNSVAAKTADEIKPAFGQRDKFLDNEDDEEAIHNVLIELCSLAMNNGKAIGIGHAKKKTLKVLNEHLAEFESKGIEFVFVSEILQ